ncbi:MAG: AmmeMemoRadiSam system radical SAM enzyme [Spirochaetaceae bacterium]|nr:MAG: AmmeMemoRadiSam system radical SAM enzyme [Spirochaetaceae bacterium]
MTARFFERHNDKLRCTLCPHNCSIAEGKSGLCGVRANAAGRLELPFYGAISALATDPIEKKPLYHFFPGSQILSVGFLGCPLRCPFCQNYRISQATTARTQSMTPAEVVRAAERSAAIGVAYTYNEPIIHIEFVLETARLAREAGLQNVLVTSGQINSEPATELFAAMDAANIDLKGFNERFYRRELGGSLKSVKQSISIAAGLCHVEVTTLVIPGKNDSPDEIDSIAAFIAGISAEIPYHLSAYYPAYQYVTEATSPRVIASLVKVARRHLRFVYSGNTGASNDTNCPACGRLLLQRNGYHTRMVGLHGSKCSGCGAALPFCGVPST